MHTLYGVLDALSLFCFSLISSSMHTLYGVLDDAPSLLVASWHFEPHVQILSGTSTFEVKARDPTRPFNKHIFDTHVY